LPCDDWNIVVSSVLGKFNGKKGSLVVSCVTRSDEEKCLVLGTTKKKGIFWIVVLCVYGAVALTIIIVDVLYCVLSPRRGYEEADEVVDPTPLLLTQKRSSEEDNCPNDE
jgi:hypothetical protein